MITKIGPREPVHLCLVNRKAKLSRIPGKSWFTADHSQHFLFLFQNSLRDSGIRGILPHILRFPQSRTRCQPLHDYDGGTRRRCVPCCKLRDSPTTRNLLYLTQKKKLWIQSLYNKCWRGTVLITSIWRINFINCTEFQSFWCDFYFYNFSVLFIIILIWKVTYYLIWRPIHLKDFKKGTITALFLCSKQCVYQETKSKKCLQYSILINYVQTPCIRKLIPLLFLCAYCFYSFIYSSMKKVLFL